MVAATKQQIADPYSDRTFMLLGQFLTLQFMTDKPSNLADMNSKVNCESSGVAGVALAGLHVDDPDNSL